MVDRCHGIGMKLASMFLRNTRGDDYAVIDVHIRRYLEERGITGNYLHLENEFRKIAESQGKSVTELDLEIWNERRVGNAVQMWQEKSEG